MTGRKSEIFWRNFPKVRHVHGKLNGKHFSMISQNKPFPGRHVSNIFFSSEFIILCVTIGQFL